MPLSVVNNGTFDTAAALVPAPFGPLARSGDVPNVSPNSNVPTLVTAFSATVEKYITYDTMTDADLLAKWIQDNFGIDYLVYQLGLASRVIDEHIKDISPPLTTAAEERAILQSLSILPTLFGGLPWKALTEYDKSLEMHLAFTATPSSADADIVDTSTGQIFWKLWDFGDGSVSVVDDDSFSHTYSVDGTYVIRLIAIGAGGIKELRKSVTINVP